MKCTLQELLEVPLVLVNLLQKLIYKCKIWLKHLRSFSHEESIHDIDAM